MHLKRATFIFVSANLKKISSISSCPSNFSDSWHLLQFFKVHLDTTREHILILTRQNQCFWRPQSREIETWISTWRSSFGQGKAAPSSPSHILPEKPAVEQLGMPAWQDKQRGNPNPSFVRVKGQWHGAV